MGEARGLLPAGAPASLAVALLAVAVSVVILGKFIAGRRRRRSNPPPAVPGWPLIGNLLQLKEKIPHKTFAKWAEIYGPIYTIRTGASTVVVLNSAEIAKEAMVTRYSSISTRKLSKALTLLTSNKAMVATSDYGDFHKLVKRCAITSVLGANAQKQYCHFREVMISNIIRSLHITIKEDPLSAVNLREPFRAELFHIALIQALGNDVGSVYVEELGKDVSKEEMFDILVSDPMRGAVEVDWRDFFPYLRWVPNRRWETKIQTMVARRDALMRALILEQKQRRALGERRNCYLDALLKESTLTDQQLTSLIWESIIEASDTTLVTTEWAMFELAKNPKSQDYLYHEIQGVCSSEKVMEEHLMMLPYLNAVFHESLRRHSPAPIIPLRYVHEETQLGGYNIQAGSEIAVSLYSCNMDMNRWDNPEEWKPERFLSDKFEPMDMYKTMAFGAGRRACAGSLQAFLISCTAIARLVQEFEWRLVEGEEENVATVQLTAQKLQPMRAYITPRNTNIGHRPMS